MNNVASYTNMNRSRLSRDLSIQFCRQQQPDNDWWLMTSDKSNKWQQQQATTINRATSTTTTTTTTMMTRRRPKAKRDLIEKTATSVVEWGTTWASWSACGLGHRLELGLGFGFPCPRRCRFTIEFLIGSAGTHSHTHSHSHNHIRTWHRKAFKFNGGCLYALWAHGTRTRSRLESKLRPGTLTAFAPCDGIPRKQQQQQTH